MKSITLVVCSVIIAIALAAFTYSSWNSVPANKLTCHSVEEIEPPKFSYNLSPRGNNTVTKERLHNAKTISDLIPDFGIQENLKNNSISVRDVKIRIEEEKVCNTKHRNEIGNGNSLSAEQVNLLKSADYSTNFFLEGFFTDNNLIKDSNKERYFNYYMTVVPEQQGSYKGGNKAFINFLETECQPTIAKVQRGNLKSGTISFIVTKAGTISNIDINSSCGYLKVDEKMVELMNNLPDDWNVATNSNGEAVNQTFVFAYGQGGC